MGFGDWLSSGFSSVMGGLQSGVQSFVGSPLGQGLISGLAEYGVGQLTRSIGMPSVVPRPTSMQYARAPLEDPYNDIPVAQRGQWTAGPTGGTLPPTGAAQHTPPLPYPGWVPEVPATQPYGVMPGSERALLPGGIMPAAPVTRSQTFPAYGYAQPANVATALLGAGRAVMPIIRRNLPGVAGGLLAGEAIEELFAGATGGFAGAVAIPGGGTSPMFAPTLTTARPVPFHVPNPVTGREVWFKPAGRPILFSGDLATARRVKKIARLCARKR